MPNLIESMVRAMGVEPTTHSKIDRNRHFRSKSVKIANFAQESDQKSIKIGHSQVNRLMDSWTYRELGRAQFN